jgi:hypothetical protein
VPGDDDGPLRLEARARAHGVHQKWRASEPLRLPRASGSCQ